MTTIHPFEALKAEIHSSPECAWGWQCNLAVPIMDAAGVSHKDANRSAALIMAQMFDYDITTHPFYEWGKSPQQAYFEARVNSERERATHDDESQQLARDVLAIAERVRAYLKEQEQ